MYFVVVVVDSFVVIPSFPCRFPERKGIVKRARRRANITVRLIVAKGNQILLR